MRRITILSGLALVAFVCIVLVARYLVPASDRSLVETHNANFAYVYVAEFSSLVGGLPTRIDAIYLEDTGLLQVSRETDRDELFSVEEARIDAAEFFRRLARIRLPAPSMRERETDRGLVKEYYPPHLRIAFQFRGSRATLWEGEAEMLPTEVSDTIALLKNIAARIQEYRHAPEGEYIRASLLPQETAREFQVEGLIKPLVASPSTDDSVLSQALAHPFHLVFVSSSVNPFSAFRSHHERGRDVLELSIGDTVFQVRSLLYESRH